MYSYKGIWFDDADTEEEAKALYPETMEAMIEGGFNPNGKEFVYAPGVTSDDVWGDGKDFHVQFREMRHYIWDNHIASCDAFVDYCRQHNQEWAEILEDPENRRVAEGFVRFTVLRQGLSQA